MPSSLLAVGGRQSTLAFSSEDHRPGFVYPPNYPFIIGPIIQNRVYMEASVHQVLARSLLDNHIPINILFASSLESLHVRRGHLRPNNSPLHEALARSSYTTLGRIFLTIQPQVGFSSPSALGRKEITDTHILFNAVDAQLTSRAIFGRPTLVSFGAIVHHALLSIKTLGPRGVITIKGPSKRLRALVRCN